jgi:hypothetical protein
MKWLQNDLAETPFPTACLCELNRQRIEKLSLIASEVSWSYYTRDILVQLLHYFLNKQETRYFLNHNA